MKKIKSLYKKYEAVLTKILFPVFLCLYPFVTVNQGIDVSDSTYSLSNFLYFERMEGMWVVSTYLSNVCGWLLTQLPFGDTLLGMNIYTTFLVSGTVLLVYYSLKKWIPAWIVFVGEVVAIGFCWIPTGILYNYLSYFLFSLGTILLYKGLVEEKNRYLIAAGVALGANVFVRIPNVTEMALIIGLWYYLWSKKGSFIEICQKTGWCLLGYLSGIIIPLIGALCQFGITGIMDMITGLTGIQNSDDTYSALSMITTVMDAYGRTFKWVLLTVIGIGLGMAMFACKKGQFQKSKKIVYGAGVLVLLRFLWGRGMFSFRYYEDYSAMYEWGMFLLYLAWISSIYMLVSVKNSQEEKLMAVLVMVILAITPLGSNNYTFQNLNNLFLIAPCCLYVFVKIYRRKQGTGILSGLSYPWKCMVAIIGIMILIQSIGFHSQFVFRDGMDGTSREYVIETSKTVAGIRTNVKNGEELSSLLEYVKENRLENQEVILYGDCPGLSFLLKMPFAIGTAWPDLDSYSYDTFVTDLEQLNEMPIVILRNIDTYGEQSAGKKAYLLDFLKQKQYEKVYDNGMYTVHKIP